MVFLYIWRSKNVKYIDMKYRYPLMMFLFLVVGTSSLCAQTNLEAGDIAITTFNAASGTQTFSFITFVDIKKDSQIKLTDHGWDIPNNDFGSAVEGTITWTATSDVPALTEVIIEDPLNEISSNIGTVAKSGNFSLSVQGDQIIVYQENAGAVPSFIYMFNRGSDILAADNERGIRTSRTLTMLPPGLVMGVHVFSSTSRNQNWQYRCDGQRSGNKESLLAFFMSSENYRAGSNFYGNGALSEEGCSFEFNDVDASNPIINPQTFDLREDAPVGYVIGVPEVDDASNTAFQNWRIVGGEGKDLFDIDPDTGMITVKEANSLDFETIDGQRHHILVEVDDISGNSSESSESTGRGLITIDVKDYVGVISISTSADRVKEGDTGVFVFSVSTPSLSPIALSIVNYGGLAAFGIDYKGGLNSIVIPANTSSVSMNIETIVDVEQEPEENVFIATILQEASDDIAISASGVAQFIIEDRNISLGVSDNYLSKELVLYPNPSKGNVYLRTNANNNDLQYVNLYTLRGALVKTVSIDSLEPEKYLDFGDVANGTYVLKVYGKKAVAVKRLIIY